ncbi:DegT/DnrJ/EryC1/StrS family aminotransferase [Streptomyces sp. BK205]|uniref:DegT/DnrJ/EryC1/StrS family aminotransferase n=1 Tax=Streptomyces sp. BK205 TaxID=2512164 RepID=UPI001FB43F74|nr:DegT/DnrJ/EryC1/StrS family aminotransferase [Streptomyces sp. BK205]
MGAAGPVTLADTTVGEEETAAVAEVLAGGWLSSGPVTESFEREFAKALGKADAIAVSSGTAALHLSLLALGIGPGDEVIMPALSFVASAAMTVAVGAVPVFADVRAEDDLTIDPADVAARVTDRTKAVVVMHYGGYAADMAALTALTARHSLKLIEDAAHAPVVRHDTGMLGGLGDVGCFSFHATKNLTTGEGGMIVAADPDVAARCRATRSHALTPYCDRPGTQGYDVTGLGFNYRPTEISSAIGRVQLGRLRTDRTVRAGLVTCYRKLLVGVKGLVLPFAHRADADTAHHLFPVVLPPGTDREDFRAALHEAGIQTSVHYPPTHQLSYYRRHHPSVGGLPVTDAIAERLVSLPLHARMTPRDAEYVAARVVVALGGGR